MKLAMLAVATAAVYLAYRKRAPQEKVWMPTVMLSQQMRAAWGSAPADTEARLRHALGAGRQG